MENSSLLFGTGHMEANQATSGQGPAEPYNTIMEEDQSEWTTVSRKTVKKMEAPLSLTKKTTPKNYHPKMWKSTIHR